MYIFLIRLLNRKKSWKEIFHDAIVCLKPSEALVTSKPNECDSYVSYVDIIYTYTTFY